MKYRVFFILSIVFYINLCGKTGYSQEEDMSFFSSKFCSVSYENNVDLRKVNRRLNLGFSNFYSPRSHKESPGISTADIVSDKLDAIFNRVEDILDMYPEKIHVTVNIYKTREELNEVYEGFFNEPNKAISFYIYKTNTIYTIESQLNENILSHEMAHCIIDHYFVILPPKKIQEMLAVYVDVHLKD